MSGRRMTLVLLALLALGMLSGCRTFVYRVEQTQSLMNTQVTITVIHTNEAAAREAVRKAFSAIQQVNDEMGPTGSTSLVAQLNKAKIVVADPDFLYVVSKSLEYSNLSDGAFDITVQPVLDLYSRTFLKENRTPTEEEITNATRLIDYRKVRVGNNTVMIDDNMSVTLGGIAKGFAIDLAIEVLEQEGISRALVNAGGQVRAIGNKAGGLAWIVALENPRNASQSITMIEAHNSSVSTSGDYERYFDKERNYHHIIDPKTGHSATELISVTVIAPKGIDADALSTTVFVLGKEKGMELVEKLPNVEALLITKEREIIRSSGFLY